MASSSESGKIPLVLICPGGGVKGAYTAGFLYELMDPKYQDNYEIVGMVGGSAGAIALSYFATGNRDLLKKGMVGLLPDHSDAVLKGLADLGIPSATTPILYNAFFASSSASVSPPDPSAAMKAVSSLSAAVSTAFSQMLADLESMVSNPTKLLSVYVQVTNLISMVSPAVNTDVATYLGSLQTWLNAQFQQVFGAAAFAKAIGTCNSVFAAPNKANLLQGVLDSDKIPSKNLLDKFYAYSSRFSDSKTVFVQGNYPNISEYVMASASVVPLFPPMRMGSETYADSVYTNYLPIDAVIFTDLIKPTFVRKNTADTSKFEIMYADEKVKPHFAIIAPIYTFTPPLTASNNLIEYLTTVDDISIQSNSTSEGGPILDYRNNKVSSAFSEQVHLYMLQKLSDPNLNFNSSTDYSMAKVLAAWQQGVEAAKTFTTNVLKYKDK